MPDESNAYRWAVAVTPPTDVPLFGELAPIQPSPGYPPLTLTTHHSPLTTQPSPLPLPPPLSSPLPSPLPLSSPLPLPSPLPSPWLSLSHLSFSLLTLHSSLLTPQTSPTTPRRARRLCRQVQRARRDSNGAALLSLIPNGAAASSHGTPWQRPSSVAAPPQGACASSGRARRLWVTQHPHGGDTSPLVA